MCVRANYIPVLCCSGRKTRDTFTYNGKCVRFVASPPTPPNDDAIYAAPDDYIYGTHKTWRSLISEQNHPDIVPAYKLYQNDVYRCLYAAYGKHFYIFSAGWGIVRAEFKLPAYNITFAQQAEPLVRRTANMHWNDFNHLQDDSAEFSPDAKIILFAGQSYAKHFKSLADRIPNKNIVTKKSCMPEGTSNYTWFYEAAKKFLSGGFYNE